MKKIKIIPDSIMKLLGISCCSWMAWASINVHAFEQKIGTHSSMVHAFESINNRNKGRPFTIIFDKNFIDPHGGNNATAESQIIIQKPLTFDASNKVIMLSNSDSHEEIFKIEMPHRTDICTFTNIDSIEGGVDIVKGIFSVPAGVVKGVISNNGQLVLTAQDGQVIREEIEGSGAIKIQGAGIIKLQTPYPIEGGIVFSGEGNKIASLVLSTDIAPENYLANLKEGNWITFDQDFDGIYKGTFSGRGGLAKMGKGTLTLTGDNRDRSSLTRIFSGEISIEKPENLGTRAPISFKGGALHFTDSLEIENALIGSVCLIVDEKKIAKISGQIGNDQIENSSLTVEGKGIIFLKSPNSYQGDTVVSNATLQLESADNLGTGKNLILKSATLKAAPGTDHLDLNQNIFLDELGIIYTDSRTINILNDINSISSEPGYLFKKGLGKLAVHASVKNSSIHVTEGSLHIVPPFRTEEEDLFADIKNPQEIFEKIDELKKTRGSSTSPMIFLNRFSIDSNADATISRNLVHIDSLEGAGKITLDADSAHLIVESGDFKGAISSLKDNDPTIVKTGQKELKLQGDNSNLFGDVIIREGKITANSTLASNVFVMQDGHLAGNAYVMGLVNQGCVSPGNSIGTIQIEKDFIQGPTGRLDIEVNPQGESDLVQVGNKASLGGSLRIIPEPGIYTQGTPYKILEAKTVEGTFQNVENTASDTLAFDVGYEPDAVILSVARTMYQLPKDKRLSENSKNLTNLIQQAQFKEGTDAFNLIKNIFALNNQKDLENAYSQMAPLQLGGMVHASYINAHIVADSFTSALRRNDRCINSTSTIWLDSIGHYAHQKHGYGLGNYKSNMGGVVIGGNHFINENIVIGTGIGYTNSCLKWDEKAARSHIASFYAGLNGGWVGDLFYANASIIASSNTFKNKRYLKFAKINHAIQSKHYGVGLISRLEAGCNFAATKNIYLRPFVDLDIYTVFERPINEKKPSLIRFRRHSFTSSELRSKIALEATGNFSCNSMCFSPGVLLGWVTQTPLRTTDYKVSLNDTDKKLVVKGFEKNKINQAIALGATIVASYKATSLSLSYECDFGRDRSLIHQASAGMEWKF